jgi:hypothetical protein
MRIVPGGCPVIWRAPATSWASSVGFQNGALSTSVPTRKRWVAEAAATNAGNGEATSR